MDRASALQPNWFWRATWMSLMDGLAVLGTTSIARTAFAWLPSTIFISSFGSTAERKGEPVASCMNMFMYNSCKMHEIPVAVLHIDWDTYRSRSRFWCFGIDSPISAPGEKNSDVIQCCSEIKHLQSLAMLCYATERDSSKLNTNSEYPIYLCRNNKISAPTIF